jgi:hypothetical protein
MHLLSDEASNAKLAKNEATGSGFRTSILYLAPAESAGTGLNVCPAASEGCRKACLFTAGRGAMASVQRARVNKTRLFVGARVTFMELLAEDLERLVKRQARDGERQAVRLNGTSDINWEATSIYRNGRRFPGVPQAFPELQFYDYTKLPLRAMAAAAGGPAWPSNYQLTFSRSEVNDTVAKRIAAAGGNVAIVFQGEALPESWFGRPVIDGTLHDQRFLDPRGVIVGLLAKGQARKDGSGFAINLNRTIDGKVAV